MDTRRVIFRFDKSAQEVVAVFPYLAPSGNYMTCYSHVGQHSGCSLDWYRRTRPATPEQYAPLLAELRGIYETGPDAVRLVIAKRR